MLKIPPNLSIIQKTATPSQKLLELIVRTQSCKPTLFIAESTQNSIKGIPIFPIHNLWSIWQNLIVLTNISDWIYVKNLYTNHKKVLYLYDLNWHNDSLSYQLTVEALNGADYLVCRCEDHQNEIYEYCGRKPELIESLNFSKLLEEANNGCT